MHTCCGMKLILLLGLFFFSRLNQPTSVSHQVAHVEHKCNNPRNLLFSQRDSVRKCVLMDQLMIVQTHQQWVLLCLLHDATAAKAASCSVQIAINSFHMTCWKIIWETAQAMISKGLGWWKEHVTHFTTLATPCQQVELSLPVERYHCGVRGSSREEEDVKWIDQH